MNDEKWVCKNCAHETFVKPKKNQVCECKGRYIHYRKCKCGKWFEDKKYSKKYCSTECSGRKETGARIGKIEVICDSCGQPILRYAANVRNGLHFCNQKCKHEYFKGQKEKLTCEYCGKSFEIYASTLKSNASGKYCSRECYWKSMEKEGRPYKGFNQAKKLYFAKPQVCAVCGTTKKIEIHHIIPNRINQNQTKENLIPLCSRHHHMVEILTREIHEDFSGNHDLELFLLNTILRSRQAATKSVAKHALENTEGGETYAVKD